MAEAGDCELVIGGAGAAEWNAAERAIDAALERAAAADRGGKDLPVSDAFERDATWLAPLRSFLASGQPTARMARLRAVVAGHAAAPTRA